MFNRKPAHIQPIKEDNLESIYKDLQEIFDIVGTKIRNSKLDFTTLEQPLISDLEAMRRHVENSLYICKRAKLKTIWKDQFMEYIFSGVVATIWAAFMCLAVYGAYMLGGITVIFSFIFTYMFLDMWATNWLKAVRQNW